jgi:Zn-dependent protease with chaperone function
MAIGFSTGGTPAAPRAEVDLAIEEYRTVRAEELVALQSHLAILRYGITGCAVLVGVAVQQHKDRYLGWIIAIAIVPMVVLFSVVIWMGEYERMARAGHYLARLEARLNQRFSHVDWPALRWESWLHAGAAAQSRVAGGLHRYFTIFGIFVGFQVVSVGIGLHFYWHQHSHDDNRTWLIPLAVAVNSAVLMTLLGYFRSSYERLRALANGPEARKPVVRQRLRVRVGLHALVLVVGLVSVPWFFWPLSFLAVGLLHGVPAYAAAVPALLWMMIVPLIAPGALIRELLDRRILVGAKPEGAQTTTMTGDYVWRYLTDWEKERVVVVKSDALNAPAIGRQGVTLTTGALANAANLPGALAHELAHHRLNHLRPLALSYLYLWPTLYYDERARWFGRRKGSSKRERLLHRPVRLVWTTLGVSGWLAWVVLRWGWRAAEYDADRFAGVSEVTQEALARSLRVHEAQQEAWRKKPRREQWSEASAAVRRRVADGRAVGYLPVPNEHPSPKRRLRRLRPAPEN